MAYEQIRMDRSHMYQWVDLINKAFFETPNSFMSLYFPNGATPEARQWQHDSHVKGLESDPETYYFLIRDRNTKEVMGASRWEIKYKAKTPEEILASDEAAKLERANAPQINGVNDANIEGFREGQAKAKKQHLNGRPHVYLGHLAVSPQHQRKGVGSFAILWGLDKSDELGLPIYLESSPDGVRAYEKAGFERVGIMPWDARDYGLSHAATHSIMIRDPQKGAEES